MHKIQIKGPQRNAVGLKCMLSFVFLLLRLGKIPMP